MNNLFVLAVQNTLVALVFGLFVYGLARVWRNPPVVHALWLLVLLKFVAPPIMRVDWPARRLPASAPACGLIMAAAPPIEWQQAEARPRFADKPAAESSAQAPVTSTTDHEFASRIEPFWNRAQPVVLGFWLGGAALCAMVVVTRVVRFERLLQDALPASDRLQHIAFEIAARLGVSRPELRYVEGLAVPFLWCAGRRPTIVLPMRLVGQFDEQRLALILAHELAHLRRRDHWVRVVELFVSIVYWWNPLARVIRRQLHEAEDLCCDAWVRWAFPDCTKRYAEVVLETAESLNASQVGARLLPASPFLRSLSLKERIEMILESRFAPSVSVRSMFVVALLACLVLPSFVQTATREALAGADDEAPSTQAGKADAPVPAGFAHKVRFEQGATRFQNGDEITIVEVGGTAEAFEPGNIYWIKGTYKLASRDRAILLASITVTDWADIISSRGDLTVRADHVEPGKATRAVPGQATGVELKVQRAVVDRGTGTFTLFLPMSHKGLPHVSFYSFESGEGFGGNYFGTGESVMKQWWGSQEKPVTSARAGSVPESPAASVRKPDAPATFEFPHAVRFEQGATQFMNGDKINIVEVRGTAETFRPGDVYWIRGTYTLASHERAMLAAYTTARNAADGRGPSSKIQSTVVNHGNGTFTLILPMSCQGWPHVSFYPAEGGEGFGGNYFGTGDSVLKRWWGSKATD
jgi:beta-lactamase regulating signal transducer with metallopeptidase domain